MKHSLVFLVGAGLLCASCETATPATIRADVRSRGTQIWAEERYFPETNRFETTIYNREAVPMCVRLVYDQNAENWWLVPAGGRVIQPFAFRDGGRLDYGPQSSFSSDCRRRL